MATQIDLGAVVPIGKGDWNSITTYERANIVRHNSTAWICKVATSMGVEPTEDSSDWYLLVKDTSSVTSVNGMKGDVNISFDSILVNPSVDDNSLKIASTSWVKTKVDNATNELSTQVTQIDSKASSAMQTANTANNTADSALNKANEALTKTGLPLGHIYLWPFSTPPDGSIQLNSSLYNRELYSDLWNLIKAKGWYKSEAEWQSIANANGGYCPWYSDGDGSTTFRTPKFAPYQKLALASGDAGKYYKAGLPNITGMTNFDGYNAPYSSNTAESSCLYVGTKPSVNQYGNVNGSGGRNIGFDASRSSSIYGNSTTVQPESHDWIVCVVAFGTATNVGSVDIANVISVIGQIQSNPNLQGVSHLIKTWKSEDGTSWYRKYNDGWIEQGGVYFKGDSVRGVNTITFNTPFSNTLYSFYAYYLLGADEGRDYVGANNYISRLTTATSFFIPGGFAGYNWYACGY